MKPLQEFFATFDWNAFLQQFLYDSKNPLLFNNGADFGSGGFLFIQCYL